MRTNVEVRPKKDHLRLRLDPATSAWLRRLQRLTGDDPATMILSMLQQIRIDDERAHNEERILH